MDAARFLLEIQRKAGQPADVRDPLAVARTFLRSCPDTPGAHGLRRVIRALVSGRGMFTQADLDALTEDYAGLAPALVDAHLRGVYSENEWRSAAFLGVVLGVAAGAAAAGELVGQVESIHDGDTLTVLVARKQVKVRRTEFDAPELGQPLRQPIVAVARRAMLQARGACVESWEGPLRPHPGPRDLRRSRRERREGQTRHGVGVRSLRHRPKPVCPSRRSSVHAAGIMGQCSSGAAMALAGRAAQSPIDIRDREQFVLVRAASAVSWVAGY